MKCLHGNYSRSVLRSNFDTDRYMQMLSVNKPFASSEYYFINIFVSFAVQFLIKI